ncbi:MAG: hypothetical protein ACRDHZ_19635, partial [Ktedonobacteraceae bacterium]
NRLSSRSLRSETFIGRPLMRSWVLPPRDPDDTPSHHMRWIGNGRTCTASRQSRRPARIAVPEG